MQRRSPPPPPSWKDNGKCTENDGSNASWCSDRGVAEEWYCLRARYMYDDLRPWTAKHVAGQSSAMADDCSQPQMTEQNLDLHGHNRNILCRLRVSGAQ